MKDKLKVLVTGCGGDIGQSIGKILKSKPELFTLVIGADLHQDHAGKFIFDKCYMFIIFIKTKFFKNFFSFMMGKVV